MKMKTLVSILALLVLMVIPSLASARWVHDFSCDYCHKANMVLSDVKTIVCLDCHSTGHEGDTFALNRTGSGFTEPVGQAIFSEGDASDALGSSTASGATPGDQTSHSWGASDTNPAAGATAPSDPLFYGNSNYSGATVSCGRCHDPHGAKTADARNPANPQLLKLGENSTDAMCVDCHTSWNINNANAFLTHPLISDYPGFQAANPTKFKPFLPNADGEMALDASGNMVCSTCHGVHFTDSDSLTTDGMGQPLSASDGGLLKGNGRMTGDASSLCQSCHVYESHGAAQTGCIDCHSGHSYNSGSPNYFVLRDTVSLASYPVGGPASPGTNMIFNSPTYDWKNAGNGYCEGCHTLAVTHNGKTVGGSDPTECGSCHKHDDSGGGGSFGGSGASCNTCHGYPPSQAPGAAAGYTGDETTSPHAIHAESTNYNFDCFDCHSGNTHDAGTFQDVGFANTANLNPSASYAAGSTTCQAVYCHGNGIPRDGAYKAADQVWAGGLNAINDCAACHGNSAVTMTAGQRANSAVHQDHLGAAGSLLGKSYSCAVCHNTTAANATGLVVGADKVGGTHVNGIKDVASNMAASGTGAVDFTFDGTVAGTCSSVYCHSDGNGNYKTPDWDAGTATCTFCHNNGTDDGVVANAAPATNAHAKHVTDSDGPQLVCTSCHTNNGSGADHVDGFLSMVSSYQTNVCNVCHGVDGAEPAPDWFTPGSDDCLTCHSGGSLSTINTQAPDKNDALFSGHNLTSGNYTLSGFAAANQTCEDCHDKTQTHLTGTGNMRLKPAFSCDTCHGVAGTATVNNINTHQAKTCLTCHDPHGSAVGNGYMVKSASAGNFSGSVSFTSRTGNNSFDESGDPSNADDICATCHTATTHNRADQTGSAHNEGTDCQTCHKPHTDPVNAFAVGAGTSCDGCHGFPPATAAHVVHSITTGNTIPTSDRSDCATCHTGADSYTYSTSDDQGNSLNHSNAAGRVTILTAAVGFNNTDKTCASACHTSTVGNGGTWTNGATLACDACHYYEVTPLSANNIGVDFALTGNHDIHFDANKICADCHTVPGDLTHISTTAGADDAETILNKSLALQDEATILGGLGTDPDPGNATCNNAACHNPSGDASEATWTVSSVSCDLCHSSTDPATNNHSAHLAASTTFGVTITCDSCHVDNLANMAHLDGAVDMAGQVTAFADPNCTNNCHQDGRTGAAAVTATWGMAAQADCTICHIQQPATGSHAKHLAADSVPGTPINCADCHDDTVENTTAATQHLDLNVDAFDAAPADLGYPVDKVLNTAFTTCNAAACHTDGTNTTPIVTPDWGTDSACVECHTTMTTNGPDNGSHAKHMTTTMEPAINCGMCHISTTNPDTDTEPGSSHRDGDIDVMEGYPSNKIIGSLYASCSNAVDGALLCHDNGLGAIVASPTWGATPANCSSCHATQPATGKHGIHLGHTSVAIPSIGCGDCHAGASEGATPSTQHGDNNVDVTNGYPTNVAKGIASWSGTCSTASCHTDGQSGNADFGTTGPTVVATPAWNDAGTCGACHAAVPSSAKHTVHLSTYSATCGDCHDTAGNGSVKPTSNHLNNLIDVRTQLAYSMTATPGNGWGTCTNPSGLIGACHGTAEARNWDNTGPNCSSCHGQSTSGTTQTGEPRIGSDMMSALPLGQHVTHLGASPAVADCNKCHNGHGMPTTDGKVQITFTGLGAGGTFDPSTASTWTYDQAATTATQDCTAVYCHSNGQAADGGNGALTYATPDWGTATTGQCGTCHQGDGVSGNASTIATGSHTAHIADGAVCNTCHSGNTHVDQLINVTSGTYELSPAVPADGTPGNGYGTCSTASCHDDGTGAVVATPTWGVTTTDCTECHTSMTTTGPASGNHDLHMNNGAACTDCHAAATSAAAGSESAPSTGHRNDVIDTLGGLGYGNSTKGGTYTTCATASCHITNRNTTGLTPVWGVTPAITDCTECHTTPPTGDTHNAHLNAQTNNIYGQAIDCASCHDAATTPTVAPASGHRNDFINASGGYPVKAIANAAYLNCTTASCHRAGQDPVAANDYTATSNFNIDVANCTQCHEASPTSGSHAKHIAATGDCATCHTVAAVKDSEYPSTTHGDGSVNVDVETNSFTKAYGSAAVTCATISCHGDGLNAGGSNTPQWGGSAGCAACHNDNTSGNELITGSHDEHLNSLIMTGPKQIVCADCHTDADPLAGVPVPPTTHGNPTIEVIGYATANAAIGNGSWTTCSAVACHEDGTSTTNVTTPAWDTNAAACTECHAAAPTSNGHNTHVGTLAMACGTCHTDAVVSTDPGANHLNGFVDVLFSYTDNIIDTTFGSCTTSCHGDGTAATGTSPFWNATITDCTACHAAQPATPSHTPHFNDPVQSISCGDCHAGATVNVSGGPAHVDGDIDTIVGLGYPQNQGYTASAGTCNAASCHDDGAGNVVTTPTWGTSSTCNECHTTPPTTGAHTTHLNAAGTLIGSLTCTSCHSDATTTTAPTTGHRDNNLDITSGRGGLYPADLGYTANVATTAPTYNTETCNTSYCHGDAMPKGSTSGTTNTPTWGANNADGCTFCHDMAPAAIGAHAGKTATDCVTCHDNTNAAGNGFVDPSLHINGTLEGGGDSCNDCHSNIGSGLSGAHSVHNAKAFVGLLSNSDYGKAAAGWYDVTYTNGVPSFGCGFCHPSTVVGHMTKQTSLNSGDAGAAGTVKALNGGGAAYSTGTCSLVYCHSDGAGTFSDSPNWTTGSTSGNCNDCHGNSPTTNAHSVHTVGIHYTDLYDSDRSGVMQAAAATNAAHGDIATSTTITCVICHGDTVTLTQNDQNDACVTCHTGGAIKGDLGISTASGTHVNGQADVAFNMTGFKSKAQLRDDITAVAELNNSWTRTNGYKQVAGDSHDVSKGTAAFAAGTCSAIACHNNNSVNWTDPVAGNCQKCHTELPQ